MKTTKTKRPAGLPSSSASCCPSRLLLLLLLLLQAATKVFSEKRIIDVTLEPSDRFIRHTEGWIRGPGGAISLRGLEFTVVEESEAPYATPRLDFSEHTTRIGGEHEEGGSKIDIAVFHLPYKCSNSRERCDWASIGVGGRVPQGKAAVDSSRATLRFCCNDEAIAGSLCDQSKRGRLIVNQTNFQGETRFISVPTSGTITKIENMIHDGEFRADDTGVYEVVFGNCDTDQGRLVQVTGEMSWRSKHGYLPGDLHGFMLFYAVMLMVYTILMVWYLIGIYGGVRQAGQTTNAAARIVCPIEKWILVTIIVGLFSIFCQSADTVIWNWNGWRVKLLAYIVLVSRVVKKGASRCFMVMLSLGWGVFRDSLTFTTMCTIWVLGAAYILVGTALEVMNFLRMFDMYSDLSLLLSMINVCFSLWIWFALILSVNYLQRQRKEESPSCNLVLAQYKCLRWVAFFPFVAVGLLRRAWINEPNMAREVYGWATRASDELIYLFIVLGVAWLWRPYTSAQDYETLDADDNGGAEGCGGGGGVDGDITLGEALRQARERLIAGMTTCIGTRSDTDRSDDSGGKTLPSEPCVPAEQLVRGHPAGVGDAATEK